MDLDSYIGQYRAEWGRLERACARGARGLAKLSGPEIAEVVRLYLRASAHLAEARTRYRDPRLHEYLNGVVARAHAALYAARPRTLRGLLRLFGPRYRQAIRRTAPFVVIAAALLVVTVAATALWVAGSREAQAGVIPPFARRAIRQVGGGVDLGGAAAVLTTFILVNNLQVALLSFALGITFGIGTAYVLIQNGALIGALAGAYQSAGQGGRFWSLVLPHGLLELTAICVAAGAGLRMGWSLVDPGERPRGQALAEEARDAVLVVVGVVPAFAVAAVLEGYLTASGLPSGVEVATGALVAAAYLAFLFGRPVTAGRTP